MRGMSGRIATVLASLLLLAPRPYRQDFIDVHHGMAATFGAAEEGGTPVLLAVRLEVVNRKVTEIESMVVRSPIGAPSGWDK